MDDELVLCATFQCVVVNILYQLAMKLFLFFHPHAPLYDINTSSTTMCRAQPPFIPGNLSLAPHTVGEIQN